MRNFWIIFGSFVASMLLARFGLGVGFGGCVVVGLAVAGAVAAYLMIEAHRVVRTWAIAVAVALVVMTLAARMLANLPLVRQDLPGLATFVDASASTAILETDRRRALEFHRVMDETQRIAAEEQHAGNTANLAAYREFAVALREGRTDDALAVGSRIRQLDGVVGQIRAMSQELVEAQRVPVRGWLGDPRPEGAGWILGSIRVFLMFLVFPIALAMLFGLPFVFAERTRRAAGWLATVGAVLGMMYGLRTEYWNEGSLHAHTKVAVTAPQEGPKRVDLAREAFMSCLEAHENDPAVCDPQRAAYEGAWQAEARDALARIRLASSGR